MSNPVKPQFSILNAAVAIWLICLTLAVADVRYREQKNSRATNERVAFNDEWLTKWLFDLDASVKGGSDRTADIAVLQSQVQTLQIQADKLREAAQFDRDWVHIPSGPMVRGLSVESQEEGKATFGVRVEEDN